MKDEDVRKGRGEEIGYMTTRRIWDERTVKECWEVTGKGPTSVRWVDVWKEALREARCRLVARDFKGGDNDRDDLFAATPPWEAVRMLMSRVTTGWGRKKRRRKVELIDAKKAHLNPRCDRDVYN